MGFIDSLRMNNIYPSDGRQVFGPPVDASPNFDAIARIMQMPMGIQTKMRDEEWQHDANLREQEHRDKLAAIAMMKPQQSQMPAQQMNTVMAQPPIKPVDKAKLDLEGEKLEQRKSESKDKIGIQKEGLGIKQQQTDINKQRADTYDSIADRNDLTASQKLELINQHRLGQINVQQAGKENLQNIVGGQRLNQISASGGEARKTGAAASQNRLGEIAAGAQGRIDVNEAKGNKPLLPVQQNKQQQMKARELYNSNPELRPFITLDDKGNFDITPPSVGFFGNSGPTAEQFTKIHDHIYGDSSAVEDDEKPKSDKKKDKAPVQTPSSKYKVTVTPGKK